MNNGNKAIASDIGFTVGSNGVIEARASAKIFNNWLIEKALPLWSTAGFDARRGCFQERLDLNGRPVAAVPRRAMAQARQIYVFSHAAHLGWFPAGARVAEIALDSLLRDFRDGAGTSGGFAFSVDAGGVIVSSVRDAYAHAFILFALAWAYRLNGDRRLIAAADETIAFIDAKLEDGAHGGVFDQFPVEDRCKRQNPHMHLLEAYLALERAAPGRGYLDRAGKLIALFQDRLFRAEPGVLLEYFSTDWSDHPDAMKRRIFEPGHHFEWVWLLREFEELSGENLHYWIERLDLCARKNGISKKGLVFDEVATDMSVLKSSHRIWPHTEAAKAAVARHLLGEREAAAFASSMVRALLDNFLDRPLEGAWIDQLNGEGEPLVDYIPASSLYHLFLAGAELARAFPLEEHPTF